MLENYLIAYAETDEILNLLEDHYLEKIPTKIRNFLKEERDLEYKIKIDINKPLIEQNLKRETLTLLAMLHLNYWCENEAEKQAFLGELAENEKEKKELEEKYHPDNLFKNKISSTVSNTISEKQLQMVTYKKQHFIHKLLDKIKQFFKKGS